MKKLLLAVLSIPLFSTGAINIAVAQVTQLTPQINHWGGRGHIGGGEPFRRE